MACRVYLQLQIAIDPVMQKGSGARPPMLPQVVSAHLNTEASRNKTAAWQLVSWVDVTSAEGETYGEACRKLVRELIEVPHQYWIFCLLAEADKRWAQQ